MSSEWVDFQSIKQFVSMEMILAHYNVRLRKVNSTYLRGKCPLPTHTSKESGDSFGSDTTKNAWACLSDSCVKARSGKKGGNVIDFAAVMENCSIRAAAVTLQNWFSIPPNSAPEKRQADHSETKLISGKEKKGTDTPDLSTSNRPLEFTLKSIDATHEYLTTRGITKETAEHFGVGFFSGKGSMAGRVVIPICNREGELIAYAGRSIDDGDPKYKLPGGFYKKLELFNVHRAIATGCESVILVEGFFGCLHVHQSSVPSVVALMGSTLSDVQEETLASCFSKAVLLLDGDEPGREAAVKMAERLVRRMFVKVINLPDGAQPDQLSSEEIRSLLGSL
jgi:DNA primase